VNQQDVSVMTELAEFWVFALRTILRRFSREEIQKNYLSFRLLTLRLKTLEITQKIILKTMKQMKQIYFFLGIFFISFGLVSAQEPSCEGVVTTYWKRINMIPVDYRCVEGIQVRSYPIDFFNYFKITKNSRCNELKFIDFRKYNLITFTSSASGCKQPLVKCSLFDNNTKMPFFKVTITQFGTCKLGRSIVLTFLVLKKYCPNKPKVCVTRKIIEDKRFLENR